VIRIPLNTGVELRCFGRVSSSCCTAGTSRVNHYIEERQTTQWPKEKGQNDKQRSTKHTHKTKDRVTRTPLKTGGTLRCSGRVSSSCSNIGTRRVKRLESQTIL
jgi:hypothetical protein